MLTLKQRLLARIVKDEGTFIQMVQDFRKGGSKLVEHLAELCQVQVDSRKAFANEVKAELNKGFMRTKKSVEDRSRSLDGRIGVLEAKFNQVRQQLKASFEVALASCKLDG